MLFQRYSLISATFPPFLVSKQMPAYDVERHEDLPSLEYIWRVIGRGCHYEIPNQKFPHIMHNLVSHIISLYVRSYVAYKF